MFIRPSRHKKLALTLSEWKTLLLDQNAEVSGWIHASHLVESLEKSKMEIFKVCLLKQVVKYFIWNSWFLQNAESLP